MSTASMVSLHARTACTHAEYFAGLVARQGHLLGGAGIPDSGQAQLIALRLLRLELENILEALSTASSRDRADLLLRAAPGLSKFFAMGSHFQLSHQIFTSLLDQARRLSDPRLELVVQLSLAETLQRLGHYEAAQQTAQTAQVAVARLGDAPLQAQTISCLARLEYSVSNFLEARRLNVQLLGLHDQMNDQVGRSAVLRSLGTIDSSLGEVASALAFVNESLAISESVGDRAQQADCYQLLGLIENELGNYDAALGCYDKALDIRREMDDLAGEAWALNNMGLTQFALGRLDEAGALLRRALATSQDLGDRHGEAMSVNNLGLIENALGFRDAARDLYQRSLLIKRELGDRRGQAGTLNNLATIELQTGQFARARELLHEALAINLEIGNREWQAINFQNLGNLELLTGNYAEAAQWLGQAMCIDRSLGAKGLIVSCSMTSAFLFTALRRYQQAAMVLHGAIARAAELGHSLEIDRDQISRVRAALEVSAVDGQTTAEDLAGWRTQGEVMSLDELAEFVHQTLTVCTAGQAELLA